MEPGSTIVYPVKQYVRRVRSPCKLETESFFWVFKFFVGSHLADCILVIPWSRHQCAGFGMFIPDLGS
jgi:hypothetical protein